MNRKLLILFSFLNTVYSIAQNKTAEKDFTGYRKDTAYCIRHGEYHPEAWSNALALKIGYLYSGYHSTEVGFEHLFLIGPFCDQYGSLGYSLGSEFLFDNRVIYGPKLSAEYNFMIIGTRLNTIFYTDNFQLGSFKIRPEVGFTLLGYISVFYGYTFNLSNRTFYNQKHSISIFGNLPILKYYGKRRIKYSNKKY